jgi:hypothetical protein
MLLREVIKMNKRTTMRLFFLISILMASIPAKAVVTHNDLSLRSSIKIAQKLNLSRAVLTLEDLPDAKGFQESKNLPQGEFLFLRVSDINFQIIFGSSRPMGDSFVQARPRFTQENWNHLRKVLQHCFFIDEDFSPKLGIQFKTLESKEIPLPNNIGDISLGKTRLVEMNGIRPRLDQVSFIRGNVMATIVVLYFEGDVSAVPIVDIARKLDARIQQNLP